MKIAIVGLGKMGHQFVVRLSADSHEVFAMDQDPAQVEAAQKSGAIPATSREDLISKFGGDKPVVWLMIPAQAVDSELQAWMNVMPEGSILIDGGNSDFRLTKNRAGTLLQKNIMLVDVGTSGGILGLENGFSMMVGGDEAAHKFISPILTSLAKPNGAFDYFGPSGSGHYIKMVHNAIEYGMMQSLSEGFRLLKEGAYGELDLAAVANVWQHGSIVQSQLNDLSKGIFKENPNLEGIDGVVVESGEARWALEIAQQMNIEMPAVDVALQVRIESQKGQVNFSTKYLSALRNKFGGHSTNPPK